MSGQQTIIAPNQIGPYRFKGTIGEGAFSVVKVAQHEITNQFYACKIVPKNRLKDPDLEERFIAETRINQQMHHINVVQICDLLKDDINFYIFMEFCPGGDLFHFIIDRGKLTESEAKIIILQILRAIHYVHNLGVSHRDLKPENILLDSNGNAKVSDFGLSKFIGPNGLVITPCGSPCYASPECLSGQPYDGRTTDIWSIGVILFALVTGRLPWTKKNQSQLFQQIRTGDYTIPLVLTADCKDIISKMLTVDCKARITDLDAINHPWFSDVNLLQKDVNSVNVSGQISLRIVDRFFDDDDHQYFVNYEQLRENDLCHSYFPISFEKVQKSIHGKSHIHNQWRKLRNSMSANASFGSKVRPKIIVPRNASKTVKVLKPSPLI